MQGNLGAIIDTILMYFDGAAARFLEKIQRLDPFEIITLIIEIWVIILISAILKEILGFIILSLRSFLGKKANKFGGIKQIESYFRDNLRNIEFKSRTESMKYESKKQYEILKKRNSILKYSIFIKISDFTSALIACASPSSVLEREINYFNSKTIHHATGILDDMLSEEIRLKFKLEDLPTFEENLKEKDKQKNTDLENYLDTVMKSYDDDSAESLNQLEDYIKSAKDRVKIWSDILERPAYTQHVSGVFAGLLNRWDAMQGWISNLFKDYIKKDNNNAESIRISRLKKLLDFFYAAPLLTTVLLIAFVPEIWFTFPLFNAITLGNWPLSICASIVFVGAIVICGQIAANFFISMKISNVTNGAITYKYNKNTVILFLIVMLISTSGIYVGGAARGRTGDVIRYNQLLDKSPIALPGIKEDKGTTIRFSDMEAPSLGPSNGREDAIARGGNTNTASLNCDDANENGRDELLKCRDKMIREAVLHPLSTETAFSIFIYLTYFLANFAKIFFSHDPIPEYSLNTLELMEYTRYKNNLKGERVRFRNTLLGIKGAIRRDAFDNDIRSDVPEISEKYKVLCNQTSMTRESIKQYRELRIRFFCSILCKLRRKNVEKIMSEMEHILK